MSDKQNTINRIYFDRSGFSSKKMTYQYAKNMDSSIKMSDIEKLFKDNVEQKKQLRGYNSFVARDANFEYQIDSMLFSD